MRARAIVAVLALAAASGGCAIIGTDDEPRAISEEEIPEELFTSSTTSTTVAVEPDYELPLFFVLQDQLVMTTRPFESEPTIEDAMAALFAGPTAEREVAAGLGSSLFPGMTLAGMSPEGVLTVHVEGEEMGDATSTNPDRVTLVYSQIVCTANAQVTGEGEEILVTIVDDRHTIKVGVGDAVLEEPVGPGHFNGCQAAQLPDASDETGEGGEGEEGDDTGGNGDGTSPATTSIPGIGDGTS